MPRLLLFATILGVAVIVYSFIDCAMSKPNEVRSISKPAWLITIVLVPLLGTGLWFLFGRPRGNSGGTARSQPRNTGAPDDDPAFLRDLETRRRQQSREEELRRRERELKAREAQERQARNTKPGQSPADGKPTEDGPPAHGDGAHGDGPPAS